MSFFTSIRNNHQNKNKFLQENEADIYCINNNNINLINYILKNEANKFLIYIFHSDYN